MVLVTYLGGLDATLQHGVLKQESKALGDDSKQTILKKGVTMTTVELNQPWDMALPVGTMNLVKRFIKSVFFMSEEINASNVTK